MSIFNPQNPGIDLSELTSTELTIVQAIAGLGDPNADRILFWDDSAGTYAYLTIGTGLSITDTTISASTSGFATTALDNLASVAINAALVLATSDAFALGSATKMWSDLFLGSGGIINFGNGEVTLTAAADSLTLAGGDLLMATSLGATGTRVLKGWFTDLESTNMPTVGGTAILTSLTAPQFTTIELGHATANTLSASAGDLSIEGNLIYRAGGTDVPVTDGGTGLSAIAALSLIVANSANTYVALTPGAGNSIRINAGGTAWEAYTPGASGATTALDNLASVAINAALVLATSDAFALGSATKMWSDLFLASGAVIDFNGDITLTHSLDTLTLAGGNLALGANSLTLTGSIGATGARVTKVWTADLEVTNDITIGGTALATTYLAKAGGTMSGNITLGENTSIALDPAGSADGKYSGITVTGTAGYTQAFGDLNYLDPTDSRWEATDANAAAAADGDARGILGMVVSTGTDGTACTILLTGIIRADANFPALTIGAPVYVAETAGDIVVAQPTTTDVVIRMVGAALTADEIFFRPDFHYTTHT